MGRRAFLSQVPGVNVLCAILGSWKRGEEVIGLRFLEPGHGHPALPNRWRDLWTAEHQKGLLAEEWGPELGALVVAETGRICQKALHR